ncbi:MAG: hypothetical protein AAF945_03545 [Actinomycetota bacterium]
MADAIAVSSDAVDWEGRALVPAVTPDGFTIEYVARGGGGGFTESGVANTGDVTVTYLTTTPRGTPDDPRITIETTPAGIGAVDSDVAPLIVSTDSGVDWQVRIERGPNGFYAASGFTRTDGPGGAVFAAGAASEAGARSQIETVLESLRLVRIDDIPTDVIDLDQLPTVATTSRDDPRAGFMQAARTTNAWCISVRIGNSGSEGCSSRWTNLSAPAAFTQLGYSDENIVSLAGLATREVSTIEIDLTDGTTRTVTPTFPTNGGDGTGFWLLSHRHDGSIGSDGPIQSTRILNARGDTIGTVSHP